MKHPRIVVTGASGFVGQYVVEALAEKYSSVVAAYNTTRPSDQLISRYPTVSWVKSNLVKDNLNDLLAGADVVLHLAGYASIEKTPSEIARMNETNVVATKRLSEACRALDVKHLVFVSSIAACEGSHLLVVGEEDGYPITPYGQTKSRAEKIITQNAHAAYEYTILRPSALFGENHGGSVLELARKIKQGRFLIFGRGENPTNFLYVRDFIGVINTIILNDKAYCSTFNVTDERVSLNDFISCMASIVNPKFSARKVPLWAGKCLGVMFDLMSVVSGKRLIFSSRRFEAMTSQKLFSNKKIKEELEVEFEYGVKPGLERTVRWYLDVGEV